MHEVRVMFNTPESDWEDADGVLDLFLWRFLLWDFSLSDSSSDFEEA